MLRFPSSDGKWSRNSLRRIGDRRAVIERWYDARQPLRLRAWKQFRGLNVRETYIILNWIRR